LEKFKRALKKQIDLFGNLEDSIYTNRAMRTVIKFKAEDIASKVNLAHAINHEIIEKCKLKEVDLKVSGAYKELFKSFFAENITTLLTDNSLRVDLEPLDIAGSIEPQNNASESNSPKHHRSRRADSEERRGKRQLGIRLVGLENQLELLGQNKKNMMGRRPSTKITGGIPIAPQK